MKRRLFVKGGLALSTATLIGCQPEVSQPSIQANPVIRWNLASSFPQSLDTIWGAAPELTEIISKLTDGRFQIRAHQAGELVPALEILNAVSNGSVQAGHTASSYYVGIQPALAFDTGVPFGMTPRMQNAWLSEAGGHEEVNRLLSDFGIVAFAGGNTGPQMGGWFRNPINSIDDIRKSKIRMAGLGGHVLDRIGATVQLIPGSEIYMSLERGVLDGAEFVGPYDDQRLGFNSVADYYLYPGWHEPGSTVSFYVNQSEWNKLPITYQQVFAYACEVCNVRMIQKYDARNANALQELVSSGTTLQRYPDDFLDLAKRESFSLYEELATQDSAYQRIYSSWKTAFDQMSYWSTLST